MSSPRAVYALFSVEGASIQLVGICGSYDVAMELANTNGLLNPYYVNGRGTEPYAPKVFSSRELAKIRAGRNVVIEKFAVI